MRNWEQIEKLDWLCKNLSVDQVNFSVETWVCKISAWFPLTLDNSD